MGRNKGTENDKRLAALMSETGRSQETIGNFFGVSQGTISSWIREGRLIIQMEKNIENTATFILNQKLQMLEEYYRREIAILIKMSSTSGDFLNKKREIDDKYQREMMNMIEYSE